MPHHAQLLTQAIYDLVYDALTAPPPIAGVPPPERADSTLLSLGLPGVALDPADFVDPWSPANPQGSLLAAECFAWLVDAAPELSARYAANGHSVDGLYGEVLDAELPSASPATARRGAGPGLSPELPYVARPLAADVLEMRRALVGELPSAARRAFHLLYAEETVPSPRGRPVRDLVESPTFRRYLARRAGRDEAVTRYMVRLLQPDLPELATRRVDAVERTLAAQVRQAHAAVLDARAEEVEAALAAVAAVQGESLGAAAVFAAARWSYELGKLPSAVAPGQHWHLTLAQPANWHLPTAACCAVELAADGPLRLNRASRFPALGGREALAEGAWHHGTAGARRPLSRDTDHLRVRFKFARVNILRRWLDPSLLALDGWSVPGRARHQLSNGSPTHNRGIFPLLPTALIVARDVEIEARWSSDDVAFVLGSLARHEPLGFGPFALCGRPLQLSDAAPRELRASFDGVRLAAPGLQVIGWISQLLPAAPPRDG